MAREMREMLRGLAVFPAEMPDFDVRSAPDDPVTLFLDWLDAAVRDAVLGPHAMTLATADAAGRVSSRVLLCKDVDEAGNWYFASDADSPKGRDLAANPQAAASFYWPRYGRQVRVSGPVAAAGAGASATDFLARSPAGRAAALTGHQSQVLGDLTDLAEEFRRRAADVDANPELVAATWTLYALRAEAAEFWQADYQRGHIRLRYRRADGGWVRELLWPLRPARISTLRRVTGQAPGRAGPRAAEPGQEQVEQHDVGLQPDHDLTWLSVPGGVGDRR